MKILITIIAALALLVAFSIPAMAQDATAEADLLQGNYVSSDGVYGSGYIADVIDAKESGEISVKKSIDDFEGINNVNINTGVMNNQAIQTTIAYADSSNALADAYLSQVNSVASITVTGDFPDVIDAKYSGDIRVRKSIDDFTGVANVNLNTGVMNNQAIQTTIAVGLSGL